MDPTAVDLRLLRSFVAVAEELHFGRAAARLHLAQPPLSQQIRRLEAAVGCELLWRTSRSVRLTPAGAAFVERARRTLRNVEEDVAEARAIGSGASGRLRVGFVGSALLAGLPAALTAHRAAHPDVEVRLREAHTAVLLEGLRDGSLDIAVARDAEPDPDDRFVAGTLLREPYVAVVPATHPAAGAATLPVTALRDEPFVSPARSGGERAYEKPLGLCERHGFRPAVTQEASHWLTVLQLVGAGFGVCLAPACVAAIAPASVSCLPLQDDGDVRSEIALVMAADEERPIVDAFAAALAGA